MNLSRPIIILLYDIFAKIIDKETEEVLLSYYTGPLEDLKYLGEEGSDRDSLQGISVGDWVSNPTIDIRSYLQIGDKQLVASTQGLPSYRDDQRHVGRFSRTYIASGGLHGARNANKVAEPELFKNIKLKCYICPITGERSKSHPSWTPVIDRIDELLKAINYKEKQEDEIEF